jgi:hypothetical protein
MQEVSGTDVYIRNYPLQSSTDIPSIMWNHQCNEKPESNSLSATHR